LGVPVGPGGKTKARGTPVKIPAFEVLDAAFYEEGPQNGIKGPIIKACGDGTVCLGFDAVIDETVEPGQVQCEIVRLPREGVEVPRGTVLKFTVRAPCDRKAGKTHGGKKKTGDPKTSPTPTPAPAGSG
jgi:hypothetical protein